MPTLTVHDLHKSYGTRRVFDGVSFAVEPGEKLGFVGANGSGKSTLFRIVAGEEDLQGGRVAVRRGLTVGYLAQEPIFDEDHDILSAVAAGKPELLDALSDYHAIARELEDVGGAAGDRLLARQNAAMERIEALGGWDHEHRLEATLTRLGVDRWERPVASLSGGERKRVALARVLVQRPDLLVLDEPTNHLDADTTLWLEETLLDHPGELMLITHDRYFLDRVVDRMIEVHRAELTSFPGGYTDYLEAKAERETRLAGEEQKQARLIEQELAWAKRAPSARTGKQKARLKRLDRTRREREESGPAETAAVELAFGRPPRLGRTVLDLHGVGKSYDGHVLIRDLTTMVRAGERIGIIGPNGAGKTTLLRIAMGEEDPDTGRVVRGKNTRIAYFDQRRADLDPDDTLLEAIAEGDWVEVGGRRVHVRSYLSGFLFPPVAQVQKVASLSGGERNRLLLARLLLEDANLLVLDEPTNDLDLETLRVLEAALVDFPGCVLVVTHDRYFLDKVATGLLVFEGGGTVHRHEGGYDLYRRTRGADEEARKEGAGRSRSGGRAAAGSPEPKMERPRRLTYREQKELEAMEEAIVAAEEERARLEAALADPALYSDAPDRVAELTEAFHTAGAEVERLYARWAELEAVREAGGG